MARRRGKSEGEDTGEIAATPAAKPTRAASRSTRVRPGPTAKEQKAGSYTKAVQTSRGRKFMQEVVAEMRKVTWPTRNELLQATMVVIVAVAIMAAFLGLADLASEWITDRIF